MPGVGEVWLDSDFFGDGTKRKFFLVLAVAAHGDVIHRLITSKAKGRPENPPCYHGNPAPGYFLGVLGGALHLPSWLVLDDWEDLDGLKFSKRLATNRLQLILTIPKPLLCDALRCAAAAQDTSLRQRKRIFDAMTTLGC
jgi:hypothetical protein